MIVLIFGGSGFVGKNLIKELHDNGYEIYLVTRNSSNISRSLQGIF